MMGSNVVVVGFGYVGSAVGAVLAAKRYTVTALDTRPELVEAINRGETTIHEPGLHDLISQSVADGYLTATSDFECIEAADVVIITVGTPLGDGEADTSQVEAAARSVAERLQAGQLVILKSTVPPFTTERLILPVLEGSGLTGGRDFDLAFCPERLAEGRALHELQMLPVVVGGINDRSTERAASFWEEALGLETIRVANARTAELSKLADNWWIDMSIAMANELAQLSDQLDIDVLEVIDAANSLPKGRHHVNILLPSMGVGGSCLTKDPWFVHHLAAEHGLDLALPSAGRQVNDHMPAYTFQLLEEGLAAQGIEVAHAKLAVLGLAFKNNTGDVRLTPTRDFLELVERSGADTVVFDPLVTEEDARATTSLPLGADLESTLAGAHAVAFLAGHDDFRRLRVEEIAELVEPGCLIVDGRMYFSKDQISAFAEAGLEYRGIGR